MEYEPGQAFHLLAICYQAENKDQFIFFSSMNIALADIDYVVAFFGKAA